MEGSSGSPGPSYTTYTYISNIVVNREDVSSAGTGPLANGAYKMLARSTGQCLDVLSQNTASNSPVGQWPYNGGLNEQWILTYLGSSQYSIIGRQSGRALSVAPNATTNGASVILTDYAESANQKWYAFVPVSGGYYQLINAASGKSDGSRRQFHRQRRASQSMGAGQFHPAAIQLHCGCGRECFPGRHNGRSRRWLLPADCQQPGAAVVKLDGPFQSDSEPARQFFRSRWNVRRSVRSVLRSQIAADQRRRQPAMELPGALSRIHAVKTLNLDRMNRIGRMEEWNEARRTAHHLVKTIPFRILSCSSCKSCLHSGFF